MVTRAVPRPGDEDLPILLSDIECQGREFRLEQCAHGPLGQVNEECTHHDDVAVICITGMYSGRQNKSSQSGAEVSVLKMLNSMVSCVTSALTELGI